jgi:ribosomal subunit interface protein
MNLFPQISFRNLGESPAIRDAIQKRVERLDRFFPRIMACRVLVESPHNSQHRGKHFHVRVDLTVPGREIVINRDPKAKATNENMYAAVRDAFDAADRKLHEYARKLRGHVKTHEEIQAPAFNPQIPYAS